SIRRGLAQSASGDVMDLGDFTQYADDAAQAEAERQWDTIDDVDRRDAFVEGAHWQRAQIAARRDEVAAALARENRRDWSVMATADRETYRRLADAVLAVLGVSEG